MTLPIKLTHSSAKYLESLDRTTQRRISDKLQLLAENPSDVRTSKPLIETNRRIARVGSYRILFEVDGEELIVSAIGPRGQVYRDA